MYCKNDKTKKYNGNEPSPKGLGYCAHAEKNGTIKKGKDGNKWIVKKSANNILKWIRYDDKSILITKFNNMLKKKYLEGKDIDNFYKLLHSLKNIDLNIYSKINLRIFKTKPINIGTFNIKSGQVKIGDGYLMEKSNMLTYVHKVLNGKWYCCYYSWITKTRPNIAIISHSLYRPISTKLKFQNGKPISVDVANIAVIDYDTIPINKNDFKKWTKILYPTNKTFNDGCVVSSGWGDGIYNYKIGYDNKKIVQFIVFFIP